jgi:hypothetical protein
VRLDLLADQLRQNLMLFVVGMAMGNLANSYFQVGRRQDALLMGEKALEFRRRVLPENHPEIGTT